MDLAADYGHEHGIGGDGRYEEAVEPAAASRYTLMLDQLSVAALSCSNLVSRFLEETEAPSEDFLVDKSHFEKEMERLNAFDERFCRIMERRGMEDEGACFSGLRGALGGLVLLFKENVLDALEGEVMAMEELEDQFRSWVYERREEQDHIVKVFENLPEILEGIKTPATFSFNDDPLMKWPDADDVSETTMSSAGSDDFFTPTASRVSSFATDYSSGELDTDRCNPIWDFTAVVDRFSAYNDVLMESLSVIENTMEWTYKAEHARGIADASANAHPDHDSRVLQCNNIQCTETFSDSAVWGAHAASCFNAGPRITINGGRHAQVTHKCSFRSCFHQFEDAGKLEAHERNAHRIFLCTSDSCGVAFYDESVAADHATEVHNSSFSIIAPLYTPSDIPLPNNRPLAFIPNKTHLFLLDRPAPPPKSPKKTPFIPSKPQPSWSSHWFPNLITLKSTPMMMESAAPVTTFSHRVSRSVDTSELPRSFLSPPPPHTPPPHRHSGPGLRPSRSTTAMPIYNDHTEAEDYIGGFSLQRSASSPGIAGRVKARKESGWTPPRLEFAEMEGAKSLWLSWLTDGGKEFKGGFGGFLD